MAVNFTPDKPAAKINFTPDEEPTNPVAAIGGTTVPEGSHPDHPIEAPLYTDSQRTKISFADDSGIQKTLKENKYKDVRRNSNGDVVAQNPNDNKWYKDQQGWTHPINWLEGHAGGALPTIGMGLGGAGGAAAGMASLPAGNIAAPAMAYGLGVAGAGAGSGIGEGIRNRIGNFLDVNNTGLTQDMDKGIKEGAMAEAIGVPAGKMVAAIPGVKPAANWVANKTVRPALAKLSNLLSFGSVDVDAAKQLLRRPDEVLSSMKPSNVLSTGEEAAQGLATRGKAEKDAYDAAQQKFINEAPGEVPTDNAVGAVNETLTRPGYLPNSFGQGGLTQSEALELLKLRRSLRSKTSPTYSINGTDPTTVWEASSFPGNMSPEAKEFAARQAARAKPDIEVPGQKVSLNTPVEGGGPPALNTPVAPNNPIAMRGETSPAIPGAPVDDSIGMEPRLASDGQSWLEKDSNGQWQNKQKLKSLIGTLQMLRQNTNAVKRALPGTITKSDAATGAEMSTLGGLKQDFYNLGDTGKEFEAANAKFHDYANDAEMVKGVTNPKSAESWTANLFNRNKLAQRQAAQRVLPPETYEKLADIGAYKSFGSEGGNFTDPGSWAKSGAMGLGALGIGAFAHATHSPEAALLAGAGGAWSLLSQPGVQRSLLGLAGRTINKQNIPMLLNQNKYFQNKVDKVSGGPWNLLQGDDNK